MVTKLKRLVFMVRYGTSRVKYKTLWWSVGKNLISENCPVPVEM